MLPIWQNMTLRMDTTRSDLTRNSADFISCVPIRRNASWITSTWFSFIYFYAQVALDFVNVPIEGEFIKSLHSTNALALTDRKSSLDPISLAPSPIPEIQPAS